jgi:hypothetical protein
MTNDLELRRALHGVDPARDMSAEWVGSEEARRILQRIVAVEPEAPSVERASRSVRLVVIAAALVVLGGGVAAAAGVLFGGPAPQSVKGDIAGVDSGLPADIRLNPDVENARSVAATEDSILYYAALRDGGYCIEISTAQEGPRGAVCTTAAQAASEPFEVTVPFVDPIRPDSPVTIGGRVNRDGVATLEIQYADGASDPIPLGDDRFFVFDVPQDELASVHADDFRLVGLDPSGGVVASTTIPAVAPEVHEPDSGQAIYVETVSNGDDLTQVLGIKGRVNAKGVVHLELRYPDGSTVRIPLGAAGAYAYVVPKERQGDLADAPGTILGLDGSGRVIARATVASVAWWEARNRQGP